MAGDENRLGKQKPGGRMPRRARVPLGTVAGCIRSRAVGVREAGGKRRRPGHAKSASCHGETKLLSLIERVSSASYPIPKPEFPTYCILPRNSCEAVPSGFRAIHHGCRLLAAALELLLWTAVAPPRLLPLELLAGLLLAVPWCSLRASSPLS